MLTAQALDEIGDSVALDLDSDGLRETSVKSFGALDLVVERLRVLEVALADIGILCRIDVRCGVANCDLAAKVDGFAVRFAGQIDVTGSLSSRLVVVPDAFAPSTVRSTTKRSMRALEVTAGKQTSSASAVTLPPCRVSFRTTSA